MSLARDPSLHGLDDCGCCEGLTARTPMPVANRPGLSAIAYRVGTHPRFKQSMLAALSDARRPALQHLNTRDDDDFSIALLDAWATVADVLTFYQERIANESYLRTATERLSIVELARTLGYELMPGVAASTHLAFTLEDGPGAPGYATIDTGTKVQSLPGPGETPQTFETVEKIEARAVWNALRPRLTTAQAAWGADELVLEGTDLNLKAGDAVLISATEGRALRRIARVRLDAAAQQTRVTLDPPGSAKTLGAIPKGVWAFRLTAAPFGHNAPLEASLTTTSPTTVSYDEWNLASDDKVTTVLSLDAVYDQIPNGSWIVIDRPAGLGGDRVIRKVSDLKASYRSNYGLAGRVTRLTVGEDWFPPFPSNLNDPPPKLSLLRGVVIYAQSEELTLARVPDVAPVGGREIVLDDAVDGLEAGRTLLFVGEAVPGMVVGETAVLASSVSADDLTKLVLTKSLRNTYIRASLTIHGNVAFSTHGESRHEVLGSGDAGQINQRFTLRQSPVTFVPADTPTGGSSTLEVRANDVLWTEVPTLFGRGPRDRVYVNRRDEEGKTTVRFGDGRTGARLPGGQENVTAAYRQGIGREGQVKAEQLSLLMTRPLGVRAVTNPLAAAGAADPQRTEDARRNAPITVLTLDRIVSLEDYQDFARAFTGIAKALATWTWNGDARGVLLTVAGERGDPVKEGGVLHTKLVTAIGRAGDPRVPLQVKSYAPVAFMLAARVRVNAPTYVTDKVLAAVKDALRAAFSFEARSFGQSVALSQVIAVIQNVAGVLAVDVDRLHRSAAAPALNPLLPALTPPPGAHARTVKLAAELLTLDPASLTDVEALP